MSKEELLKLISDTDTWLFETKKIIDEHAGEPVEEGDALWRLCELTKQVMINQILIKRYILEEYGITVMTQTV